MYCIVNYSRVAERARTWSYERRDPASTTVADTELATTLESLDEADNYADWIIELIAPHLGQNILEVGAGHGVLTERLARHREVTASEPSERAVELLHERFDGHPTIKVVHADAKGAVDGSTYDSIVLINVLEHIYDDAATLRVLKQGLRPGGKLILYVPAFNSLYSHYDRIIGHHRRYRIKTISLAATRAGLEVVDARYVNSIGFFAWATYAKALGQVPTRSWSTRLYDRAAVPVLRRVERDWQPPLGQSVLCIARRPETDDV
jgi:2-polyprenyl-3-methyl-5-hydroxy-6-metoxy-1,4-benzoquinol methylase